MNPFTKFLSQWSQNRLLNVFVEQWDTVEALVIRVYRTDQVREADEAAYREARRRLLASLPKLEAALRPFWEQSKVGGRLDHEDPFRFVLNHARAADFRGNWTAMQYLPAAREALNGLILESTGGKE